jgi:DNA-binding transcriptional LysR family regulator
MQLSIEQLDAFVTTVETGSFSAAARKLGKAQSSVSGLIINLEIDIGFELFDRSSRTPQLTKEGLSLLNDIKAVTKCHKNLLRRVDNMIEDVENEISIAFDDSAIASEDLFQILNQFEETFPSTSLLLVSAPHKKAPALLKQKKVDLAIAISQDDYPEEFAFRGVFHSNYCSVVGRDHPLAKQAQVTLNDLSQYRHIRITDCDTGFRRFDTEISSKIWYTNSKEAMLYAVKNNIGWANLPESLVANDLLTGQLVKLNTTHQTVSFPHCVDILWQSESIHGKCLNWLIEAITQLGKK